MLAPVRSTGARTVHESATGNVAAATATDDDIRSEPHPSVSLREPIQEIGFNAEPVQDGLEDPEDLHLWVEVPVPDDLEAGAPTRRESEPGVKW